MKKYIIFFISLCTIMIIIFVYNAINIQEKKEKVFVESGYILNGSQSRYYFKEDETYTKTYDDKISFYDTDGNKVTLNRKNFIHYESGNIITLQDSVLLDLSKITEDPITYYNVSSGKEIKKLSNRFVVKNLDKDMPFDQGICKISANKYILLGKNIKIILNNGTTKDIKDYIEIEYFDNEIVNIYNQEINYQTISSDSYIELDENIKLNLGTKIISKSDENKMSLDSMVINSDDNINLADINEKFSLFKNKEKMNNEINSENKVEEKTITNNSQTIVNNDKNTKQETVVINTQNDLNSKNEIVQSNNQEKQLELKETQEMNSVKENEKDYDDNTLQNTINNEENHNTENIVNENSNTTKNNNNRLENVLNLNSNIIENNNNDNNTGNVENSNLNSGEINNIDGDNKKEENGNENNLQTNNNDTISDENTEVPPIVLVPSVIEFEIPNNDENEIDRAIFIAEPTATFENIKITSVGVSGEIQIKDENDLLSKDDNIVVKIINNETGKIVYQINEEYGVYNIPIAIETLKPNCNYSIVVYGKYILDEKEYTKNILYKNFVTLPVGINITKDYCTDSSINYSINITDSDIESVVVSLLDSNRNIIPNRNQVIRNSGIKQVVSFEELNSNTNYTLRVSEITYSGVIQTGENWTIDIKAKTLKQKCKIDKLNYAVDRRTGTFKLIIDDVTDKDNAIKSYRYMVYQFIENEDENGNLILSYDEEKSIYERETTNKEIVITVGDEKSDSKIKRSNYYGFKVVATYSDNEKDVEVESNICGAFTLNSVEFPSVRFERIESQNPATKIEGWLYILDKDNVIRIDENNPLTITYSSDVDEIKVYKKITSTELIEAIKDSEEKRIKIDLGGNGFDDQGLKSETTYNISVYGTVQLEENKDEEEENKNLYKNVFIGSSMVSTKEYSEVVANLNEITDSQSAFAIEFNLYGDEINRKSISSVDIMLYEGSGDINAGEYRNWNRTITKENYLSVLSNVKEENSEIKSLEELLFDNTLIITPSFIAGGQEKNYKESDYQVIVTATIDGTSYPNKIPIVVDNAEDENKGNILYTNKEDNEKYSAVYIMVKGSGTTEKITEILQNPIVSSILNENAESNGLEKKDYLDNKTIIGYKVNTDFTNTGSLIADEITYYVWDKNGNPILDNEGTAITKTLKIRNQSKMPEAIFQIEDNTNETSGIHRGKGYYFSYTIKYKDLNGGMLIWPICESIENNQYTNQTLKTGIMYPPKQEPTFVVYPKTSGDNYITLSYSCYDYDKALKYYNDVAYLDVLANGVNINKNIAIIPDKEYRECTIDNLESDNIYTISYLKNLNSDVSDMYFPENLITQKFDGIYYCDNVYIKNIEANSASCPNNIKVSLAGDNIERIAACKGILRKGNKRIDTDLLTIKKENENYYIYIDILELNKKYNMSELLQTNIEFELIVYYDSGKIGYELNENEKYVTYINTDGSYLMFNKYDNFEDCNSISGNLYSSTIEKNNDSIKATIKDMNGINKGEDGKKIELMYSPNGLKRNDIIVVQKQISEKSLNSNNPKIIYINNIVLGVNVNNISVSLGKADIKTEIQNINNMNIDNIYLELWSSKYRNIEPEWNSAENRIIPFETFQEFTLTGLKPAEYYYIRFKYLVGTNYIYTYDIETQKTGRVYEFETMATIDIENVEVKYNAESYRKKALEINYNVNEEKSTMYEKTKYNIYKKSNMKKININQNNILEVGENKEYNISNGTLVVNNLAYSTNNKFSDINEKLNISPERNILTFGEEYVLEIIPVVLINNNDEIEIEKKTIEFTLSELNKPKYALNIYRNTKISTELPKYIRSYIYIKDTDGIIYGDDEYGEYEMHIYKYKNKEETRVELDFYDHLVNGQNLRGKTFNLRDNGKGFKVYIVGDDVDYSYTYVTEIILKYDKENNENNLKTITKKFEIKGISNEANVSIGSSNIELIDNNFEVRFYDSFYNIEQVNTISYSIYEMKNSTIQTDNFTPSWTLENVDEDISYYKTICPAEITEKGIYVIKMNLYANDVLVGQIDTSYVYD